MTIQDIYIDAKKAQEIFLEPEYKN